jgi:PAS domain S-box-containing protein
MQQILVDDTPLYSIEKRYIHKDGHPHWVNKTLSLVRDEDGAPQYLFAVIEDIHDRKQAELLNQQYAEELAEWRNRYDIAGRASGQIVYEWDAQVNVVTWGANTEAILGYLSSELPKSIDDWIALIHPEEQQRFCTTVQSLTPEQPRFLETYRAQCKDGTYLWIEDKNITTFNAQGEVKGAIGFLADISERARLEAERKRAEQALEQNRQELITAQRVAHLGSFSFDVLTGKDTWSEELFHIFGRDPNQGEPTFPELQQLWHPDDRDHHQQMVQHTLATGEPFEADIRLQRPNGSIRWITTKGEAEQDNQGDVVRILGTVLDITERKGLESELRQSQAFLQSIYEGTAVGIGVLEVLGDDQYRYLDTNPAMARIAGVPDDFLKGKRIEALQPFLTPEAYGQVLERYRHCVTTGESLQFEEKTTLEGQDTWWLTDVNPLTDENDQVTQLIISTISISDRKQAEQALQQLNEQLEARVRERTQALLDSQTELKIKEAQYRSIFETVGEGIFINDLDTGAVVEVNPAACQMHGYERDEFLSVPLTTYVHPDSHHVFAKFIDALSQDQSFTGEAKGVRKDGSCFDAEVTGRRIFFNGKYHALGTVRDVTERNVAERAQQRLVSLIENNQDFIGISTLNHDPLFLNTAGLSLVGLSSIEEMQAYRLRDFFFPEDWAKLDEILALLAEVGTWHGEFRLRHFKTGELIEVEVNLYLSGGQDPDNPPCVAVSARDIRDRKQAERDRQKLVSLIENSSDFIGISTLDCEPLFLNAAGMELVGLDSIAEMQTHLLTDFFFPEDLPALGEQISQLSGMGQWYGEFRMRHFKTGAVLEIEVRLYLLGSGEADDPLCVAAVARDIRERKQAEQERQKLISLLETSRDFIGIATLAGRPLFINAAGLAMVGLENFEIDQTHHINDFFMPESLTIQRDQILPTVMAQDNWQGEIQFRHFQTGTPIDIDYTLFVLRDPVTQDPVALGTVSRDIRDRKRAEAELQQLNAELEQRVVDRTTELQTAKESAESANQAKSVFLANMSHELRTPLNAILGFAQLLIRDRDLEANHQEQLGIISRSGEHLLALINDILEMSKIEAGGIILNPTDVDLYALLDTLEDMLRFKAQTKGVSLRFERHTAVPQYVTLDENKLRQVLINLLGNAIKFTDVGHVTLRVQALPPTAANPSADVSALPYLHFAVEDTGPGIVPEEIELLFQPFVQAQAGQRAHQGTGLGLPISQKFIQMMGGEITLTSILGQGSTFEFAIPAPLTQGDGVTSKAPPPQVLGLAPDQPQWRVLIVEDHRPSRILLLQLLTDIGCDVRTAESGEAALTLWQQWHPHLIWMDIRMPGMDGYEATRRIRALERGGLGSEEVEGLGSTGLKTEDLTSKPSGQAQPTPQSPAGRLRQHPITTPTVILALTANTFAEEVTKALAAGCDDFVRKPLEEAIIFDKMAEHLGMAYTYGDTPYSDAAAEATPSAANDLTIERLATMPTPWLQELYQSAAEVDDGKIATLCTTIPSREAGLGSAILAMARNFDFEPIIDLAEAAIAHRRRSQS